MNAYEPILIKQGRLRNALMLVVTIAFTIGSCWLLMYGDSNVLMCIAGIAFFGVVGIPAATMSIIKPGYLRIDENGFEFDNVNARNVKIGWDQIESLELRSMKLYKYVYVRCVPGSQRLTLTMSGMSGYSAKRIVEIMADYGHNFHHNKAG